MRRRITLLFATTLVCTGLSAGCSDRTSELDPDVVAKIARSKGDARGYGLTGRILGSRAIEVLDCPCPTEDGLNLNTISLCAFQELGLDQLPGDMQITQTDGHLVLTVFSTSPTVATGRIDQDGSLSLGAVSRLDSVVSEGYLVTRIEGSLTPVGDEFEFEADIRHRIIGDLDIRLEPNVPDSVDCTEHVRAAGVLFPG